MIVRQLTTPTPSTVYSHFIWLLPASLAEFTSIQQLKLAAVSSYSDDMLIIILYICIIHTLIAVTAVCRTSGRLRLP